MSKSASFFHPPAEAKPRRVLVTGAAGRIGQYFVANADARFDLRLSTRPGETLAVSRGEVVEVDLTDLAGLKQACAGIDTVLHLAAVTDPWAEWEPLLQSNIIGAYNLFVAAKAAGCRRVVYASTIHAVSGYPEDVQISPDDPVNPGDLYGVTKCFGEALGRYMAEQEGLSTIVVRIGGHGPIEWAMGENRIANMDAFVSDRDLLQLFERCIDDEAIRFAIFHGLSEGRFKRLDISNARQLLGYAPQDDFAEVNPTLSPLRFKERVSRHNLRDGFPSGLKKDLE